MTLLHPDADLSLSVLAFGADLIRLLKAAPTSLSLDELMERFLKRDKRRSPQNFFSGLEMLFAVGVLDVANYRARLIAAQAPEQLSLDLPVTGSGNADA